MAKQVNICGNADDLFQRYKRDRLQTEFTKKCGGQTKITNLDLVCNQLHVDKKLVTKELQRHLSTSVRNGDTMPGDVNVLVLESALEKIIQTHVLCANCGLPERNNEGVCNVCGHAHARGQKTSTAKKSQ